MAKTGRKDDAFGSIGTGDAGKVDDGLAGLANDIDVLDPAGADAAPDVGADADVGEPAGGRTRKRRADAGIKRGPRKKGQKASHSVDLSASALESLLYSIHLGIATITQRQELALSQEEAKALGEAAAAVASHYDFLLTNAKTVAWGNLIVVAGMIYIPRIIALRRPKSQPQHMQAMPPADGLSFDLGQAMGPV